MMRASDDGGFTLIEIMVAVAILGAALMLLLDTHFSSTCLLDDAHEEFEMQSRLQYVLNGAEMSVQAGKQDGSAEFGGGDDDSEYTYSWTATDVGQTGDETGVPLVEVTATVNGPNDKRSMTMFVFLNTEAGAESLPGLGKD